jgi:hypothetical protein
MKEQRMSIKEFLNGGREPETFASIVKRHLDKYGIVYKVVGATVIILVTNGSFDYAFASSGIEAGAEKLYAKLLSVGKWIIIFKGGFDTIKNMANGDFDSAKKGFVGYLLVYLLLFGLPWAMDEIDIIFKELTA